LAIIVSQNGKNAKKVEKSGFDNEDYLQQYVHDNPEVIPLYDIKEDIRLLVLAREFPTTSGPIDALGVDRDGELYCIETKLYKNPDKRLVVAQVLDYGASLWHSFTDFSEFTSKIDQYIAKTVGGSLSQRLQGFFGIDDEEATTILQSVRSNLNNGKFKFVVLMDKLHDQLKELIVFLNENSRFDIFAVEIEFYRHESYEILIPKLFGAQVKKEVSSTSQPTRRWDEDTFFQDLEKRVEDPKCRKAIRDLYEFSKLNQGNIGWGRGVERGSFSPRFEGVAQRSVFSVFSDGVLTLNFEWLHDDERTEKLIEGFAERLKVLPGIVIPQNYQKNINLKPEKWCPVLQGILAALNNLLTDARGMA
jgi:hypothetical protein